MPGKTKLFLKGVELKGDDVPNFIAIGAQGDKDHKPEPLKFSFRDALKKLCIEDYLGRIFNADSNGELYHTYEYIAIADALYDGKGPEFRQVFLEAEKRCETLNWPEGTFFLYFPGFFARLRNGISQEELQESANTDTEQAARDDRL